MAFVHYTITEEELGMLSPKNRLAKRSTFVAEDERDIIGCRDYYLERGLVFPPFRDEALVFDGPRLDILLEYTMMRGNKLGICVLPEISFHINPNAWETFKSIAQNFEKFRRGTLYKWDTGNTAYSQFYFLDRKVMEALARQNLQPYEEQVEAWRREDQSTLADLERKGLLGRLPGQLRVYDGDRK